MNCKRYRLLFQPAVFNFIYLFFFFLPFWLHFIKSYFTDSLSSLSFDTQENYCVRKIIVLAETQENYCVRKMIVVAKAFTFFLTWKFYRNHKAEELLFINHPTEHREKSIILNVFVFFSSFRVVYKNG